MIRGNPSRPHLMKSEPKSELISERLRSVLAQIPEYEQNRIAYFLSDLMAKDEAQWESAFAQSQDKLKKLGDEVEKGVPAGKS